MSIANLCHWACVLAAVSFVQTAHGVNIISSQSRIWGNWSESNQSGLVSNSSVDVVSVSISGISTNVRTCPVGLSVAPVSVSPFRLNMEAYSPAWYEDTDGSRIDIWASSTTRFSAGAGDLKLSLGGQAMFNYYDDEQDLQFSLRDVTSSTTLFDLRASSDWSAWFGESAGYVFTFPVESSHEYEFSMSGWITAWDAKECALSAAADLTAVPEPGSLSLLALGFGSLWFTRRALAGRNAGSLN